MTVFEASIEIGIIFVLIKRMGCFVSTQRDDNGSKKKSGHVDEMAVFVPGLRIPKNTDFSKLQGKVSVRMIERLSAHRIRIEAMASAEGPMSYKSRKKGAQHGGSNLDDIQQALEDYLPVLLGLTKEGSQLKDLLEFEWVNQEDDQQETAISSVWYEVLSVLHMMALVSLLQSNALLIPRAPGDGYHPVVTEESKKSAIVIFLKAAGYLDCALRYVLLQMSSEDRMKLPADLKEGILHALSVQALGQGVDIQLGLAIENPKATLAVKRRLACEKVKYWQQAQNDTSGLQLGNEWGEKHRLFIQWKYTEAKAAAYYYHGLILDEGSGENSQSDAITCLKAAEQFLKESKKACVDFSQTPPTTRIPSPWGATKHLSEKIPKDVANRARINRDSNISNMLSDTLPKLPDFAVALKPDEFNLPPIDPSWKEESANEETFFSHTEGVRGDTFKNAQIQSERRPLIDDKM